MTRTTRLLLALLLCGTLLMATTVGITAAAVYRAGTISVDVTEDDGGKLRVAVPAGLARFAIWLTPASLFEQAFVEELEPWLPAARAAWRELERTPDFVLVEVRAGREHVRVEKRGGDIVVFVDSDDATVRVAVPWRTLASVLDKFERSGTRRA